MNTSGTNMKYTNNYIWSTSDVLGQGATGMVYRGRHKRTGNEYAIKVFNSMSFMSRAQEVRKREFDVLRKVDHINVVRLFDIEEESVTKHNVIVMELCAAGSLFSVLENPECMYGFSEDEFIRVVSHITSGMKHLHDKGIVHRDLKPGNIMRSFADDGTAVYKLTDFGAARELKDDEQFVSLYGTEEYLHPDIYERAVLRKQVGKTFSASVDLWSMGVTFYHIATGFLPFRPFGGARRNKEIMYKITTEKPSGVISGVQHTEQGAITWYRELPKTCRFSMSFKKCFTPVLAGILECDPHKIWTFDHYFTDIEEILTKKIIHIFSLPSSIPHRVYVSPEKTLVSFQEQVAELTEIRSSKQLMLLDGLQFSVESFIPVKKYPATSTDNPIVLLSTDMSDFQQIPIPHTCKPPKVKPQLSHGNDSSLAKVCSSTLFDIRKTVKYLLHVQSLIRLGVKWFVSYLKTRVNRIQLLRLEVQSHVECLKTNLEIFEEHYQRETSLLRIVSMILATSPEINELKLYFTQITENTKILRNIRTEFEQCSANTHQLERAIIYDKIPSSIFVDDGPNSVDRLEEKMTNFSEKSREIAKLFKKHKHQKRLLFPEEQLHKFEKKKLAEVCDKSVSLFTDQSVRDCKQLHKESTVWFNTMNEYLKLIFMVEEKMHLLKGKCQEQDEAVRKLQRIYKDKLSTVETLLKDAASRPTSRLLLNGINNTPDQTPKSWDSAYSPKTNTTSQFKQAQLRNLKKCLNDARSHLHQVKIEVQSNSKKLNSFGLLPPSPTEN